jgi:hypothetical protein
MTDITMLAEAERQIVDCAAKFEAERFSHLLDRAAISVEGLHR